MPHIHEKIDYAADTFIVNEGAVLLRMHEKYNMWLPPGGHVELDEDFVEAALREVKEEVGMDVRLIGSIDVPPDEGEREVLPPRFINRHPVTETHEHISFMYFAISDTREVTQGEGEISNNIRWFTDEELDDEANGVTARVRKYAKAALVAAREEATR